MQCKAQSLAWKKDHARILYLGWLFFCFLFLCALDSFFFFTKALMSAAGPEATGNITHTPKKDASSAPRAAPSVHTLRQQARQANASKRRVANVVPISFHLDADALALYSNGHAEGP